MKRIFLIALLGIWPVSMLRAEPVASVNNPANIGQSLATTVVMAPLDGSGNAINSLAQAVQWSFLQPTITAAIAASPTPYTFTGIHVWYRVDKGTGITVKDGEWGGIYIVQAPKNVPAGILLNCVYSAPPIMAGDLTCTLGPDAVPPSPPTSLAAASPSLTAINLTWSQSIDNVGVASYSIERCPGVGCTNFNTVGASTVLAFGDVGLASGQSYSYRVSASDIAGNLSGYSNVAAATVLAPSPPPPPPPVCIRIPPVTPLTGEVKDFTAKMVDGAGATWTIAPRVLSGDTLIGQVSLWRTPPTGGTAVRQFGGIYYAYRKDNGSVCVTDDPKTGPAHSCFNGTGWNAVAGTAACQ